MHGGRKLLPRFDLDISRQKGFVGVRSSCTAYRKNGRVGRFCRPDQCACQALAGRRWTGGSLAGGFAYDDFLAVLVDNQTNDQIAQFIRGILYGLIPTTLLLVLLMFLLEHEVKFAVALGISLVSLSAAWVVVRAVVA